MAKFARERAVKERRALKLEKKQAAAAERTAARSANEPGPPSEETAGRAGPATETGLSGSEGTTLARGAEEDDRPGRR